MMVRFIGMNVLANTMSKVLHFATDTFFLKPLIQSCLKYWLLYVTRIIFVTAGWIFIQGYELFKIVNKRELVRQLCDFFKVNLVFSARAPCTILIFSHKGLRG